MTTRVAFVCHWDWVLYRFRLPVARALLNEGVEVVAVCPAGPWVDALEVAGLRWREWPLERGQRSLSQAVRAVVSLSRILRDEQPDGVHLFTIEPIVYGTLAAALARTKVVIAAFSGLGWLFSSSPSASRLRRVALPVLRRGLRRSTVTVMNTQDRALVVGHLVPEVQCRDVPEGVDVEVFHPPAQPLAHDSVRIITACRLLRTKGILELCETARRLPVDLEFSVLIAGVPDPGNPDSLTRSEIDLLATTPNVEFLGQVDDVEELLRTADIAVLATTYPEGAPRFLMEAAASGVPAVASDLPGCRTVVIDGETGVLVTPGDLPALTSALRGLIDDPQRRVRLGTAARRHAEQHLGDELVTRAHRDLYRDLGLLPQGQNGETLTTA